MDELSYRIRLGDEQAFELLFRKYYTRLCGFANKFVNNIELSEELVQEVFLKLWQNRAKLNDNTTIKSYLFKLVQNQSLNSLDHKKVEQKYADIMRVAYPAKDNFSPYESLLAKELEDKISIAINDLPTECKKIFELSRNEGLKYKEIAQKLNISIKTVETQISRALKKIRIELKDYMYLILAVLFLKL